MATKANSGAKTPKQKPGVHLRLSDEDTYKLDECAGAAKTDRTNLIRLLIRLAYKDLVLSRQLAAQVEREAIRPTNGHEAKETG